MGVRARRNMRGIRKRVSELMRSYRKFLRKVEREIAFVGVCM